MHNTGLESAKLADSCPFVHTTQPMFLCCPSQNVNSSKQSPEKAKQTHVLLRTATMLSFFVRTAAAIAWCQGQFTRHTNFRKVVAIQQLSRDNMSTSCNASTRSFLSFQFPADA